MSLYECSVRFDKTMDDGSIKRVAEPYLVDALSFTEAEARMTEEISQVTSDHDIFAIKRTRYSEVVYDSDTTADKWFKAKLNFITLDERTGKEKKAPVLFIVNAGSIDTAKNAVHRHMKGTMADYEIVTLDETKIMDVYMYSPQTDTQS